MSKQSQSSNQILIIIGVTVLLAIIIGLMIFNQKSDPATNDLNLELSDTSINSNNLETDFTNDLETNPQDSTTNNTQPPQSNNPTTINNQAETTTTMNKTNMPIPNMIIDQNQPYFATLKTNLGTIKIELFADKTPKTVNNFVYLAQNNFYDDLIFHRVIEDFMIQGGCPLGNGTGSPGYKFEDEQNSDPLVEGSLAMANSGPNTNGSQFFIVTAKATPWLDGLHTHFGKVVEGMDVVKAIEKTPTQANDKPAQDVVIQSVVISNN